MDLKPLSPDHHLRNAPLAQIGAFYRPKGGIAWREVFPSFNIANNTFNQLAPCWTDNDEWKATKAVPDPAESATSGQEEGLQADA